MGIKKLRRDARGMLESGLIIMDAVQCVNELVENALDAKCTAVAVRINFKDYKIEVVDNGTGISPDDLNMIGERFMTSKCSCIDDLNRNIGTFGYRGQAIASIIDVSSKLMIETKSDLSKKTLVKIFTKGKPPSVTASNGEYYNEGTTVTVFDFMSALPVRQKRVKEIFDMQEIKNQLEYLALIHNQVCFTLRDENKQEIIFQSRTSVNAGFSFADLFGLAVGKFLMPINYEQEDAVIKGFIALERHTENNLQFLYVNKRIVSKNLTHKFLNCLIDKYINEREKVLEKSYTCHELNFKKEAASHNVYLIQIECPYSYYDMFRSLRKTTVEFKNWDLIFHYLKSAIKTVLKTDSANSNRDLIIKRRKIENIQNLARKGNNKLQKLNCGIQGNFVNRNQFRRTSSNKKSASNHVNYVESKISDNMRKISIILETKNNFTKTGRFSVNNLREEVDEEMPVLSKRRETHGDNLEMGKDENIVKVDKNYIVEFAVWLCSKMEYNHILCKMYREFLNKKLTSCNAKVIETIKRKQSYDDDRERKYEVNWERRKKFCFQENHRSNNTNREVETLNGCTNTNKKASSIVRGKWKNLELKEEKLKFRAKLKRETETETHECFQSCTGASGDNYSKTEKGNESIHFSCFGRTYSFLQEDFKRLPNCSSRSDSTNSWISHKGRKILNVKHKNCSGENSSFVWSHEKIRKSKLFIKNGRKHKINADFNVIKEGNLENETEMKESGGLSREEQGGKDLSENLTLESGAGNNTFSQKEKSVNYALAEVISKKGHISSQSNNNFKLSPILSDNNKHCDETQEPNLSNIPDTLSMGTNTNCTPFNCSTRYNFIPKGLSPTVLNRSFTNFGSNREKISSPSRDYVYEENSCDLFSKCLLSDELVEKLNEECRKNMIHYESGLVNSYMTATESKINSALNTFQLDKQILSNINIIGQWDNKFIICSSDLNVINGKYVLFLFDQHAVDERIRLEKLLKDMRNIEGSYISINCNPPIKCKLDKSTVELIPSVENVLLNFGLKISPIDSEHVLFHQIPISFKDNTEEDVIMLLESLVKEIIREFYERRGWASDIPRVVYTALSTRACKNAVKFNDILSLNDMRRMINDLVLCKVPFQCAHGRPSVVPILDINIYKTQVKVIEEKLNFRKFINSKSN